MRNLLVMAFLVMAFVFVRTSECQEMDRPFANSKEKAKKKYLEEQKRYEKDSEIDVRSEKKLWLQPEKQQEETIKELEVTKVERVPTLNEQSRKAVVKWESLTGISDVIESWKTGEGSSNLCLGKVYEGLAPTYVSRRMGEIEILYTEKKPGGLYLRGKTVGIPIGIEALIGIRGFAEAENNLTVLDAIKGLKTRGDFFTYELTRAGGKNFLNFSVYANQKMSSSVFFSAGNLKQEFDKYYMTYILLRTADGLQKEKRPQEAKEYMDWAVKVSGFNSEALTAVFFQQPQ